MDLPRRSNRGCNGSESSGIDWYRIGDVLKWPTALVFLVLFFRAEVRGFLTHARSLGFGGTKLEAEAVNQTALQRQPRSEAAEQAMRNFADPLLIEEEKRLAAEISKIEPSAGPAREELVLRYLTAAWIQLDFERVYRLIFGSQLVALQGLNEVGLHSVAEVKVRATYDDATSRFADFYKTYGFEPWLGFLFEARLIERGGDSLLRINQKGRSFPAYLMNQGYPLAKIG
jgi:hypothetical protein